MADQDIKFYLESRIEIDLDVLIALIIENAVELDSWMQDAGYRIQKLDGTNWSGAPKWKNVGLPKGTNKPEF